MSNNFSVYLNICVWGMRKIERFYLYLDFIKMKVHRAEVLAELGTGTLSKTFKSDTRDLSPLTVERIINRFPDLNRNWFLTGMGKMINSAGESWPSLDDVDKDQLNKSNIIEQIKKERENINKSLARIDELLMLIK